MPLTGKTSEEIDELETNMLEKVPASGESIGNMALREALKWEIDLYLAVRERLIDDSALSIGRGRGGSVRRVVIAQTPEFDSASPRPETDIEGVIDDPFPDEKSLYPPMLKVLENRWVKDQPFSNFHVEDTSKGGARRDGRWSRPDLTVLASTTYTYVPGRHFDVITFEVKHHKAIDVTSVYEALAHRRSATHAYVLAYVPDELLASKEDSYLKEVSEEAARHGIGFIVAGDPNNFDTWDIREVAESVQPDSTRLNTFIRNQITEGTRDAIVRWFR